MDFKNENCFSAAWLDVDGDGYLTEKDFEVWINGFAKLFPDMSKEQKDILASKKSSVWNDLWDGKGKGEITEDMYIERFTTWRPKKVVKI